MDQTFGRRLYNWLVHREWTQLEIAKRSGLSTPVIAELIMDQRHPHQSEVESLAKALGIEPADLTT